MHGELVWKLNTSNMGKFEELKRFFAQQGQILEATHVDVKEIQSDPLQVIAHKASQLGERVIVDDTALDVEGASIGINVKWLLAHLSDYVGHKAMWTVLLAYRQGHEVLIYKGTIEGTIVLPRGKNGFGFDPVFQPEGAMMTLAESKPDAVNARAKVVEALIKGDVYAVQPCIESWDGEWQGE
jgi:XTP/dITP diphosphohydrolase